MILNIVAVTVEFDAAFTLLQQVGNCTHEHIALVWIMWIVMIILYSTAIVVNRIKGWCKSDNDNKINFACCIIIWMILLVIAFAFYLISDNRQPLECYHHTLSITSTRLSFVLISSCIFIVLICTICCIPCCD